MSKANTLRAKCEAYMARQTRAGNQLHTIYIVEEPAMTQDPTTGLPTYAGNQTVTQMTPAPYVRIGGRSVPVQGGAVEVLGDAQVERISRTDWPLSRLQAAVGFRIDDPANGDLYQILTGSVREVGPATFSMLLQRVSQPRT